MSGGFCLLLVALGLGHVGGLSFAGLLQHSGPSPLRPRDAPLPPCIVARFSRNNAGGPRQDIERILDQGGALGEDELTVGMPSNGMAETARVVPVEEAFCGEAVFPLPSSEWESLRVFSPGSAVAGDSANPIYTKLLAQTRTAFHEGSAWKQFISVNRDQFNFRFMYLLTAQMLAAKNIGDETKAAELKTLREQIAREIMLFDVPLFKQIGLAEGRVGQVLGLYMQNKPPTAEEVVLAAGSTGMEVLAFWGVLAAAVAAWEAKLGTSVEDLARSKLKELNEVRFPTRPTSPHPLSSPLPPSLFAQASTPTTLLVLVPA